MHRRRRHTDQRSCLANALEALGPTYVKFRQTLGSRPDVVPPSLAGVLSALQDDMTPFDGDAAREIVRRELSAGKDDASEEEDVQSLVEKIDRPVAAASIGQVYKAQLPGRGDVAVKVQRPGVRQLVEVGRLYLIVTLPCYMLHCPTETALHSHHYKPTTKYSERHGASTHGGEIL